MRSTRTRILVTAVVVLAAAVAVGAASRGVARTQQFDQGYQRWSSRPDSRSRMVRANTPIEVRLNSRISTEDARQGNSWTGTVDRDVRSGSGGIVIPSGSQVEGVVTTAAEGTHETQAQLGLEVREISVGGNWMTVNAQTEAIVAGSHRAKKIGAIAGGALVGAVVGHQISHEHGSLIGGLLGGAIGYGATRHAFRTLQLEPGTVIQFTTTEDRYVAARR